MRRCRALLTLAFVLSTNLSLLAGHGAGTCCPACNYTCEFSVETVTEKEKSFEVECQPICIPPITFPWEKHRHHEKNADFAQPAKCGKVRVVRVLVRQDYECSRCKYKWSVASPKNDSDSKARQAVELPYWNQRGQGGNSVAPVRVTEAQRRSTKHWGTLVRFSTDLSRRFIGAVQSAP